MVSLWKSLLVRVVMAEVKNIEQVIMIGHDEEGNEVLFNFKNINNCMVINQKFNSFGCRSYDVEFHANEHWITFQGEDLYPSMGMYARETKESPAEATETSFYDRDGGLREISW